jgi:hypothetical protein
VNVPRSRRLPGQVRAMPGTGIHHLLLYSISRGRHRFHLDSQEEKKKSTHLMGRDEVTLKKKVRDGR